MALYREGKAAMAADGTVTGTGTKWQSSLSLIRPGATIMFLSSPIQMAVVNKVVSDTEIKAITTSSAVVESTDYAILLSDSLTVDGLAQDVAETLRYYQSQETVIADAVEFFKEFDFESLQNLANQIKSDSEAAESSAEAAATSESNAKTSETKAKESENAAKSSEVAAETARDQIQQIINDAGEQSTLVALASHTLPGASKVGLANGFLSDYIKEITYESLGAKFDGINDDTAAIQAGNELVKQGYLVKAVTPNGRARITSQVIFYAGSGAVDMGTAYLKPDRTLMTTGYAARVMGDNTRTYNLGSRLVINMIGPYGEIGEKPPTDTSSITTQLCGLNIDPGTNTQVSNLDINWKIFGFMKNVRIGSKSVYLIRAWGPMHSKAWVCNVEFDCQNDAGENINFFGGTGSDCRNSNKTAADIYSTSAGHFLGLNLIGYSQDYNDVDLDINGGYVYKLAGQFENNSLQPYVKMSYTVGKRHPTVILQTVNIDGGNDQAQEAGNTGRPAWFKIGNGCIFHADGGTWGKYDKMHNTKLFDVSANGPIALSVKNIYFDTYDGIDSIEWGAHGNPIRNYDFSDHSLSGWKTEYKYPSGGTPVTPTITYDDSKPIGNAAKISSSVSNGETTTLFGQKIQVTPGGILYLSTNLYWENIVTTNGTAYFGYTFYDAFGDEITHNNIGVNLNLQPANATAPVLCSGKVRIPSGAAFVHVGIRHYQMSGDVWMGKMNAFVQ
ncbi:tailspike depolymerase [Klebsiella phage KpS2]